jgi:hypothetical protein
VQILEDLLESNALLIEEGFGEVILNLYHG